MVRIGIPGDSDIVSGWCDATPSSGATPTAATTGGQREDAGDQESGEGRGSPVPFIVQCSFLLQLIWPLLPGLTIVDIPLQDMVVELMVGK